MNYSKATNYGLHTLVLLASLESNELIGVQALAAKQDISVSYLSKILTKLSKAGLIESSSGAQGGYRLARKVEEISFFDVIAAIEGMSPMFKGCSNEASSCRIEEVMQRMETMMVHFLKSQKIGDLV